MIYAGQKLAREFDEYPGVCVVRETGADMAWLAVYGIGPNQFMLAMPDVILKDF